MNLYKAPVVYAGSYLTPRDDWRAAARTYGELLAFALAGGDPYWSGFPLTPREDGNITPFLHFLEHNICGGNTQAYEFFLAFFAQLLQAPHRLPRVGLVLRGEKRSGKSGIVNLMARIVGERNSLRANHSQSVTREFNACLVSKLLLVSDDASWDSDQEGIEFLNNLVTVNHLTIQGKNRTPIHIHNFCRVVIVGNDQWLIPKTHDDGRFFIIDVPPCSADDAF